MAILIYLTLTLVWAFIGIHVHFSENSIELRNITIFAGIFAAYNLMRCGVSIRAWRRAKKRLDNQ